MVSGKGWQWLEGLDPESIAQREKKKYETKLRKTAEVIRARKIEDYKKALPEVLKEMQSGDWNTTYTDKYIKRTGSSGQMDTSEIVTSLEEGLRDGEELNGELGRAHSELAELRDRANSLVEAIPGSTAASEAVGILESAVGKLDSITSQVTQAMTKFQELLDFYNEMP